MKIICTTQYALITAHRAEDSGEFVFVMCRRGIEEAMGMKFPIGSQFLIELTGDFISYLKPTQKEKQMHNLEIAAVVRKHDGSMFYREEHEWDNMEAADLAHFVAELKKMEDHAKSLAGKHEDSANLTVTLSMHIDNKKIPDVVIHEVSYHALSKFERDFLVVAESVIKLGEEKLKHKT